MLACGCSTVANAPAPQPRPLDLLDSTRDRRVPVALYFPARACTAADPCRVALLSPGYGLAHTDYTFLAAELSRTGYLVVAIQHVLPTDPPLARTGALFDARLPLWQQGADTLRFVRETLQPRYPGYDWLRLVLIGHSHGGDISALALTQAPELAGTLITLDHRRYPLPRNPSLRVLSVRGSDFEADPGVLPSQEERASLNACIDRIEGARHDDMHDGGPEWLKNEISVRVGRFLGAAESSRHDREADSP